MNRHRPFSAIVSIRTLRGIGDATSAPPQDIPADQGPYPWLRLSPDTSPSVLNTDDLVIAP